MVILKMLLTITVFLAIVSLIFIIYRLGVFLKAKQGEPMQTIITVPVYIDGFIYTILDKAQFKQNIINRCEELNCVQKKYITSNGGTIINIM